MSLTPRPSSNFQEEAFQFINGAEGFRSGVYGDPVGVPTIGYGYALAVKNAQGVWSLKSSLAADLGALSITLTPAQQTTLNNIVSALNAGNTEQARTTSDTLGDQVGNGDIRTISSDEGRTLFNLELDRALTAIRNRFKGYLGEVEGEALYLFLQDSKEMVALASMAYNGVTTIGSNITSALDNNDRAEAWYEIQYNSNGGTSRSQGIANRRYREADLFGIYNTNPTEDDYKAAYRMLTRHKAEILGPDGVLGNGDGYEDKFPPPEAGMSIFWQLKAARDFLLPLYDQGVSIAWSNILVGESNGSDGDTDTRYYRGTESDYLTGSDQSDLIFGESGNDILDGGQGQDILHGGSGQDIYRIRPGDGNDIVIDTDGKGLIVYGADGQTQALALGIRQPNSDNLYRSPDGSVVYQLNGTDLTITLPSQQTITVKDYTPGDLHLSLIDKPADPSGPVLTGTDANNADVVDTGVPAGLAGGGVLDRNWQSYQPLGQLVYPASGEPGGLYFLSRDGNNLTYQTILGQGGDDFLLGNPGAQNIRLDGGSGNDWIIADYNDVYSAFQNSTVYTPGPGVIMDGGAGNDALQGGFHDDWIEGGTGHDQLYGGQGDDYLAGGTGNDWLAASDGDDVVIGGPDTAINSVTDNDVLLGGAGADNLLGGAGDDALYGDTGGGFLRQIVNVGNGTLALVAWNGATQQHLIPDFVGTPFQQSLLTDVPLSEAGDDYLDGGAGNDKLFGGAGDDLLDGGTGDDKLYGEAGDDEIDQSWGRPALCRKSESTCVNIG